MANTKLIKKTPKDDSGDDGSEALLALIRAKHGKHSIYRAGEAKFLDVIKEPTGIHSLDFALGGGYPYGRFIHIYGPEAAGKTFTALKAAAQIHKQYPSALVAWMDFEHIFDNLRASQMGVDLNRLILICEPTAEQTISIAEELIDSLDVKLFVVDSVAAIAAAAEILGDMTTQTMGTGARLMNKFIKRWLCKHSPKTNTKPHAFVILLNQVREKIQKGGNPKMPPKPQPTGGRGLRYFVSVALEMKKGKPIVLGTHDEDSAKTHIGHESEILVEKNNTFPPKRVCKFLLCTRPFKIGGYTLGANSVDNARDLLRYAKYYNIVVKSGSWLEMEAAYNECGVKFQGTVAFQEAIAGDQDLQDYLYRRILDEIRCKLGVYGATTEDNNKKKSSARRESGEEVKGKKATGKRKSVAQ